MTSDGRDVRAEADEILRSGLRSLLNRHGDVHVVGSYVRGLMTWRDRGHLLRTQLQHGTWFVRTRASLSSNPRTTLNRPLRTTTSVGGRSSNTGNHRTGGNPATPPSSRERSSRLPARIRRRGVSSPAQTLLRPQSRRSLISRRRSTRTESSRRHSPLMRNGREPEHTFRAAGNVRQPGDDAYQGAARRAGASAAQNCVETV
jgi:hypothetical protein